MTDDELREALARIKFTKSQAARTFGYSRDSLRRWCDGVHPVPRHLSHLLRLHERNHELEAAVAEAIEAIRDDDMEGAWRALRV